MSTYKSPGVYVEEVSSGSKPIEPATSNVAAFLGECLDGPLNEALPIANWGQFTRTFGGFDRSPYLATAVYQWFNNGGGLCFVSVVARPEEDAPAPAPPAAEEKPDKPRPARPPRKASRAGLYIGEDKGPGKRSGINTLNAIPQISMVCAPGLSDPAIHDALLTHCERLGDRFAILDGPEEIDTSLDQLYRPRDSTYGAFYFPWVEMYHPGLKENRFFPPSGALAGVYARTDRVRGVHKAPANEIVRGAVGLKYDVTSAEQELLNPRGINVLRDMGDRGIRVWGARTVSTDPEWKYINVRRLFLVVEQSIREGTQWCVFEPNDHELWKKIVRNVRAYLLTVWRTGALFGQTPDEAFYVKCDSETNPPEQVDLGQVTIEIGIAPVKPAEFVVFRIAQLVQQTQ